MEEKIKEIVSVFTKIPVDEITDSTPIDRSAINSSILVHRLYAKLAVEGFPVENYWDIKTFGNLKKQINGNSHSTNEAATSEFKIESNAKYSINSPQLIQPGIGIDIEEIGSMPRVNDIREDEFYKMNFAPGEIAYCILQQDSYASLAGLFAAKEAIVKASNNYESRPFSSIIIDHLPNGKPVNNEFQLSISHTKTLAVAVAIRKDQPTIIQNENTPVVQSSSTTKFAILLLFCLLALSFSILAIILVLKK